MTIHHDGPLDIATGRHRWETSWKNTQTTWGALVVKLSKTHRTAETLSDYNAAPKSRQDEIKDIGGFVGGYLTNGRRKSGNVAHRQIVTLDLDFADPFFWSQFSLLYSCAAAMYSTHKHAPTRPRLRLLIPLDREVFSDEYVAIARRIAGNLGIEAFDDTTFQPERLMYWPSTSADGTYLFEFQDGPFLSADAVLASYRNWRDTSEWPVSSRHSEAIKRSATKQGDPYEKPGVIGAFCRLYSIADVIEQYLPEVYQPTDNESRYTYAHGSTAGGLVLYEDKFAYSHHGTDPISGRLCNAFDLVRLHLFGARDENVKAGTPVNKFPSYEAMQDLCTKDGRVRTELVNEKLEGARQAFEDVVLKSAAGVEMSELIGSVDLTHSDGPVYDMGPPAEEANDEWKSQLDIDRKGNIQSTIDNIVLVLENDPRLKGVAAWDEFEQRPVVTRRLPWRGIGGPHRRFWMDTDDANLAHYLEKVYRIGSAKIDTALGVIFERHRFHPIRQYLNSLTWDGRPRVAELLIKYLGSEDCNYTRAITRKVLAAACARVFEPGCKFDYALVLVSGQGTKKSSFLGRLGKQWFSDSFHTVTGTQAYEQLQGVWIMEMAELAGFRRGEVEAIKNFISKPADRYRVAYGRRVENFPRQCILIGTTNTPQFNEDATGGRRFWPAEVNPDRRKAELSELTDAEVGQIWAEAVQIYRAGEPLYLSEELEKEAAERQLAHTSRDARTDLVEQYLETLLPVEWPEMDVFQRRQFLNGGYPDKVGVKRRERVSVSEIWCECLGGSPKEMTTHNTKPLHHIMRMLPGWREGDSKFTFGQYGKLRGYYRVAEG